MSREQIRRICVEWSDAVAAIQSAPGAPERSDVNRAIAMGDFMVAALTAPTAQRTADVEALLGHADEILRKGPFGTRARKVMRDLAAALRAAPTPQPDEDDGKIARDHAPRYSQVDLDMATKPLHAEIERLRAAPAPTADLRAALEDVRRLMWHSVARSQLDAVIRALPGVPAPHYTGPTQPPEDVAAPTPATPVEPPCAGPFVDAHDCPKCDPRKRPAKPIPDSAEWWRAVAQGLGVEIAKLKKLAETPVEPPTRPETVTRAQLMALVKHWRNEADGAQAVGYYQQADRVRACAGELAAALAVGQTKETL